jgi:hypothetical protein
MPQLPARRLGTIAIIPDRESHEAASGTFAIIPDRLGHEAAIHGRTI